MAVVDAHSGGTLSPLSVIKHSTVVVCRLELLSDAKVRKIVSFAVSLADIMVDVLHVNRH